MKRLFQSLFLILIGVTITGCNFFKQDAFEDVDIFVTTYVIEFLTQQLYGNHSNIRSIYPDGIDIHEYTLTPHRINYFSRGHLFIFNGSGEERQIAVSLINHRGNNLHIIDVAKGLEVRDDEARLWISPSHTLMVAQNIRNGLKNLVTNTSLLEEIDRNYEELKILLAGYDAEFKLISENASNRTIIAANSAFNFLTRYGFEVINIDDDDDSSTAISRAEMAFRSRENTYLFILEGTDEENEDILALVETGATLAFINPMINLTDEQRRNGDNYITFMEAFIDALRNEVF